MSTLRKMRKSVAKANPLVFDTEMYNSTVGSLVISAYILSDIKPLTKDINRMYKKVSRNPEVYFDFWLDDEKFIDKTLSIFNMKRPKEFPIAFVNGKLNSLFLPYVDENLLPIREDGIVSTTAQTGKIYPITFED